MSRLVGGNCLTLLTNGEQYFPALAQAIEAAREEVFLETYIFADDVTGSLVADALARAAARGVRVRLLIDGFGARDFPARWRAQLRAAGVELLVFRPRISPWSLQRSRLRRMHRKLACIDGCVAFVGGINVVDDYDAGAPPPAPPRHDYAVQIDGPLAAEVRDAAARLWSSVAWASFGRRWPGLDLLAGRRAPRAPEPAARRQENQSATLVVRDNLRHRRAIEQAYLARIQAARGEVLIACAYFLPGRRFRRVLLEAAARGVRVRLLLQGRVEYPLAHYASRALYGALLAAGVEIYEYEPSFLHAKVAVFDRVSACVGSSNIDPFSLLLALEANVFVDDPGFAGELRASLERAIGAGAPRLRPQDWSAQPFWLRLRSWLDYQIARLALSLVGHDRY